MINPVKFLESSCLDRSLAQGPSTLTLLNPANNDLPADIIQVAAGRRWPVLPVRPLSRFCTRSHSALGYPTSDLIQLRKWWAELGGVAHWAVQTGPGSVIVLEMNSRVGHYSLDHLSDGEWDCGLSETLQYRVGRTWFAVFRHPEGRARRLSPAKFPGIRIHSDGKTVLIPPSLLSGVRLAWVDSAAPTLLPPAWLNDLVEKKAA